MLMLHLCYFFICLTRNALMSYTLYIFMNKFFSILLDLHIMLFKGSAFLKLITAISIKLLSDLKTFNII